MQELYIILLTLADAVKSAFHLRGEPGIDNFRELFFKKLCNRFPKLGGYKLL